MIFFYFYKNKKMFQDIIRYRDIPKNSLDANFIHYAYILYDNKVIISTGNDKSHHAEHSAIEKLQKHHKYQYLKG